MMPNRSADPLFQLIRSLQKGEKRNFKLYVTRNSSNEDLKIIQLFDVMDKITDYDDAVVLGKIPSIKKEQLANRKAHLYRQILASLRVLENNQIDIVLHEQMDFARILYNKGLYHQSLKILDRTRELAAANNQYSFLTQILFLEKKIESLFITRSFRDRARQLSEVSRTVIRNLDCMTLYSNLALELYSWYINHGHARNQRDEEELKEFFYGQLPNDYHLTEGFYQRLYLYMSFCWYAFIIQDFLLYYRYCKRWVDLFSEFPHMLEIETPHYIKGLHNLVSAHFDLRNYEKFQEQLEAFEVFAQSDIVTRNSNNTVQVFVYLNTARINRHFLEGSFTEGLQLVPEITEALDRYSLYLDRHRILVFYYKIASLYFGAGDAEQTIVFLNKIINWKVDLRNDLQCYARLLHLIAHYELGNFTLLEYLGKSVYRFLAKMENLGPVEEAIFAFLRKALRMEPDEFIPAFEELYAQLRLYENDPIASRAFSYLDILSWLESKIKKKQVQDVIRAKFLSNRRRSATNQ